ncbi:hypothetical protein L596_009225 [Steinernema carpocapsae]|uniref:Uncharacterized protein n=1 Tax=Steinernema carpocapsae TaxID=34508 RepID=A0A4U5PF09_STECR|nr:hypothetical protein L596_009225 [Steinernema carpocapsae]
MLQPPLVGQHRLRLRINHFRSAEQVNKPSSTASFSTLRKASIDESASVIEVEVDSQSRNGQNNNSMTHMIATAIASTTAVRPARRYVKNWQRERPRSMYASVPDTEAPSYLDHHSFSQITPPPIHKKFATVSRTESFHQSPLPRHSMTNLATVEDIPSPVPSHLSIQKLSVPCPVSRVSPMPKSPEIQPKIFPQVARKPLVPHPIVSQASITVNGQKPIAVSSPRPLPRTIPQPPPRTSLKLQSPSLYHTARVYVQQQRPLVKARETVPTTFIAHPALVVSRSQSSGSSTDSSPVPIRRTYVVQPIRRTDPSPKPEKKWFESESL